MKIDNCGDDAGKDFNMRADAINASGTPMMIENSNQGFGNPQRGDGNCKGNMQASLQQAIDYPIDTARATQ